jgi:hypothetical protein
MQWPHIKNPPDERRKQIIPLVKYAVEKQISSKTSDYWDYATLLELSVLDKDQSQIHKIVANALRLSPEKWQVESTLGNIYILKEAREGRNESSDIEKIVISELENYISVH